ncbi:uncharacterized protein PGTG_02919 [Puccinia graminis f. sp. tritici CRL 75-36-700-3]|uniref:Uncharacterized protein n=1 Tax=Puccinia graminis f. sp. tritici (strain CRL 75-36-700-3 / race SCCL) TaxID=418459 RepID=E3JWQ3_PUCGT|nr:uncharacterized protein PGTG_02919 [Puccinia graminis f. sp. tritici CRL 75-36-700-3]EFP76478.1 hypothetical protein PGTG_02919 [Puccinia graminis f. sp. tritici CRL 75-36-700-3]
MNVAPPTGFAGVKYWSLDSTLRNTLLYGGPGPTPVVPRKTKTKYRASDGFRHCTSVRTAVPSGTTVRINSAFFLSARGVSLDPRASGPHRPHPRRAWPGSCEGFNLQVEPEQQKTYPCLRIAISYDEIWAEGIVSSQVAPTKGEGRSLRARDKRLQPATVPGLPAWPGHAALPPECIPEMDHLNPSTPSG